MPSSVVNEAMEVEGVKPIENTKCPFCGKEYGSAKEGKCPLFDEEKAKEEPKSIPENLKVASDLNTYDWHVSKKLFAEKQDAVIQHIEKNDLGKNETVIDAVDKANIGFCFGTESHHMICVNQCYIPVKDIMRIGQSAGYDINKPKNGIALPSIVKGGFFRYEYYYKKLGLLPGTKVKKEFLSKDTIIKGKTVKYYPMFEKLGTAKEKIALFFMDHTKKQWHVGGHKFPTDKHNPDYVKAVITELVKIIQGLRDNGCGDKEKRNSEVVKALDQLCLDIRKKLDAFKDSPADSDPFYVSQVAFKLAKAGKPKPVEEVIPQLS